MKSWTKMTITVIGVSVMTVIKVAAQEQDLGAPTDGPWLFSARLGGEFSDNRDGVKNNKENNLDISLEPRVDYRFRDGERTLLDVAVMPMVKWHSNPRDASTGNGQNDTELFGTAAAELSHQLNGRTRFNMGDAITYNDDPEISNGGANVRYSNNHIWNDAHAGLDYDISEKLETGVKAAYTLKRYTDSVVADNEDEDILDGQADLKFKTGAGVNVMGLVGASKFENKAADRDRGSSVLSCGVGVEKIFNPDFIGKINAGYQHGEYNDSNLGSIDAPNGSAELTLRAASATRFRVGASYGLYAPYVRPYSIQTMTAVSGGVDHDVLSKRLMVSVNGQYGSGHYKSEGAALPGGDDNMVMVGVRGEYRLNRTWSLNAGYTFENWDSQVRESFVRNMVDVGVKAQM
ncbi:MAG: outer membrane beta-barrel protein [bacterium]